MISESLTINCNDCDAWYTEQEVDWNRIEESVCTSCGAQSLRHAHDANIQTPWQAMKAEIVELEIYSIKKKLDRLERILIEELGGDL